MNLLADRPSYSRYAAESQGLPTLVDTLRESAGLPTLVDTLRGKFGLVPTLTDTLCGRGLVVTFALLARSSGRVPCVDGCANPINFLPASKSFGLFSPFDIAVP